jgi:hypothetical protein
MANSCKSIQVRDRTHRSCGLLCLCINGQRVGKGVLVEEPCCFFLLGAGQLVQAIEGEMSSTGTLHPDSGRRHYFPRVGIGQHMDSSQK